MPDTLPGAQVANPPPLPNTAPAAASLDTQAAVAKWNAAVEFRPAPSTVWAAIAQHPELVAWAQGSIIGTLHIAQP